MKAPALHSRRGPRGPGDPGDPGLGDPEHSSARERELIFLRDKREEGKGTATLRKFTDHS